MAGHPGPSPGEPGLQRGPGMAQFPSKRLVPSLTPRGASACVCVRFPILSDVNTLQPQFLCVHFPTPIGLMWRQTPGRRFSALMFLLELVNIKGFFSFPPVLPHCSQVLGHQLRGEAVHSQPLSNGCMGFCSVHSSKRHINFNH